MTIMNNGYHCANNSRERVCRNISIEIKVMRNFGPNTEFGPKSNSGQNQIRIKF